MRLGDGNDATRLAIVLGCKKVELPIKYLGLSLDANYKDVGTWDPVIERFESRLAD